MTAKINGLNWSDDKNNAYAHLDYDHDIKAYFLSISSGNLIQVPTGMKYRIIIDISKPFSKGKFFFIDNAYGSVDGYSPTLGDFRSHYINGFVEITDTTRNNVGGTFECIAVTDKSSSYLTNDTIVVTDGKFLVPISIISGK